MSDTIFIDHLPGDDKGIDVESIEDVVLLANHKNYDASTRASASRILRYYFEEYKLHSERILEDAEVVLRVYGETTGRESVIHKEVRIAHYGSELEVLAIKPFQNSSSAFVTINFNGHCVFDSEQSICIDAASWQEVLNSHALVARSELRVAQEKAAAMRNKRVQAALLDFCKQNDIDLDKLPPFEPRKFKDGDVVEFFVDGERFVGKVNEYYPKVNEYSVHVIGRYEFRTVHASLLREKEETEGKPAPEPESRPTIPWYDVEEYRIASIDDINKARAAGAQFAEKHGPFVLDSSIVVFVVLPLVRSDDDDYIPF